ncbi:uncharacterized protein [Prorops nasuta]|uniref:uncharacterized protein isoform X2 n=1 Tax=Prorops nasuta TaxID=863751 RepID=UPI0034CE6E3F
MAWCVVIGQNCVATIPESWILKNNSSYWWPPKNVNASQAIKKAIEPNENWGIYPYSQSLGPVDSYKEAKKLEIKSQALSSEADTDTIKKTLFGKCKEIFFSDDSNASDVDSPHEILEPDFKKRKVNLMKNYNNENAKDNIINLPKVTYVSDFQDNNTKKHHLQSHNPSATTSTIHQSPSSDNREQLPVNLPAANYNIDKFNSKASNYSHTELVTDYADNNINEIGCSRQAENVVSSVQHQVTQIVNTHNNCCSICRSENEKQYKKLYRMLHDIKSLLLEKNSVRGANVEETAGNSILSKLPLNTLLDFTNFEKLLEEDSLAKYHLILY